MKAKTRRSRKQSLPFTRNASTMTESQFFSMIRSTLRSKFRYWKPMIIALNASSRPNESSNKRLKKEFQCKICQNWFKRADVQIDHIIPCGSLSSYEDVVPFIQNLTNEDPLSYQVLCKPCHQTKTNEERQTKHAKQASSII